MTEATTPTAEIAAAVNLLASRSNAPTDEEMARLTEQYMQLPPEEQKALLEKLDELKLAKEAEHAGVLMTEAVYDGPIYMASGDVSTPYQFARRSGSSKATHRQKPKGWRRRK